MRARAFTLMEIMIATTLFALLMGMYYEVFTNVVQLEDYARRTRSFASVGPAVLDLVEDDLLCLYTHPRAGDAFPFRGTDDSMASEPADRMHFVSGRPSIHLEELYGDDTWVRSPINEVGYRLAKARGSDAMSASGSSGDMKEKNCAPFSRPPRNERSRLRSTRPRSSPRTQSSKASRWSEA